MTFRSPTLGALDERLGLWTLGLGWVVCGGQEPRVEVVPGEDGSYTATICGHFTTHVVADHPFRVRLLMLFPSASSGRRVRLLEVEGRQRGGRRARDGRTLFVPQQQLAAWFGMSQPDISRIEGYWLGIGPTCWV